VARRKKRTDDHALTSGTVDESEWADWWKLRDEMGKRLGGRDATGVSDPEVLEAARRAQEARRGRRR
jgi:hypothetical protein